MKNFTILIPVPAEAGEGESACEWNGYNMMIKKEKAKKIAYILFLIILAVYPLRHIWLGVEVTDGGYSAGNYRFMGDMNPMWLFATYLANVTGHFLTKLPGGDMLIGLRCYTALFISMTAVFLYLFFTKAVRMEKETAFFGGLLAISLCWCPTTILYNYMTYFFFDTAIVVLYLGLVREKRALLFCAGVLLGMNVLVRFPNLTEAALILSLWYYGWLQRKRIKDIVQETGICLIGYLTGVGLILADIAARYGIEEYITGITRLMRMPAEAADYSALSMVLTVLLDYKFSSKWLIHMVLLTAAGCLVSGVYHFFGNSFTRARQSAEKDAGCALIGRGISLAGRAVFLLSILVLFRWWYGLGVFNIKYYTYESMFQWVAVFLILVILAGMYVLFSKKFVRNEKLLASMTLILIAVTPLGSNNHLYPNMNNMFLVFPFGLSLFWRFLRKLRQSGGIIVGKSGTELSLFPVRAMLGAFLAVMSLQCLLFGAVFTFRDGMSGQKRDTKIEKNDILRGMVTNAPLAEAIEGLTTYVEETGVSDRSVILYGQIPALSYMLDMPPALSTSWPDLASYNYEVMAEDMEELRNMPADQQRPIIIVGAGPEQWIRGAEMTEAELAYYMLNEKWEMIYDYMVEQGYEKTYGNGMFTVYE